MPDLIRLEAVIEQENADFLSAVLALAVPHGWEEQTLPDGRLLCRVHTENQAFCAELEATLRERLPGLRLTRSVVPNVDWTIAWREFFTPVQAGRFLVLPPWLAEEHKNSQSSVLLIEPKTAFGTGHHATTALCLRAISELAAQNKISPADRFLDLGCGSGILSIACAKLGLAGLGLDIDLLAIENSQENSLLNGLAPGGKPGFDLRRGSIEQAGQESFNLILANILAAPLKELAPHIVKALAKNGRLVLSGILDIQADAVESAYRQQGLPPARRILDGEWAALVWS